MILALDLETYSTIPINNGSYKYSESVEIMLFSYAFDDGPVQLWDRTLTAEMPSDLRKTINDPETIFLGHNIGGFDRIMLKRDLKIDLPLDRMHDTMAQAYAHGLPGGLDLLCDLLKAPVGKAKDKNGRKLIQLFCAPRKNGTRATRKTHPLEWDNLCNYAKLDIEAARYIYKKMPNWNYTGFEHKFWQIDQKINQTGVAIDTDLIDGAIRAVDIRQKELKEETMAATDGEVSSATRRDVLLKYVLKEYGVELPDMQASTLERRIADPDLPEGLKNLLAIRLQATTSSTAKYRKIRNCVSSDNRLRGTLQFCGAARTGRDAGRILNPQNLPRPTIKDYTLIELGIDALKADCADLLFDNVMDLASNTIRGVIVAEPGNKLLIADLANIEGRYAAWIADEKWKLQAFRDFDKKIGPDLYKLAYARMFGIKVAEVTSEQRQIGKTAELACFGPNTRVLTNAGIKRIVEVLSTDRLWDGTEWVNHEGLMEKGVRQVVRVAGIRLTPEHLVLTGKTWSRAEQLVSNKELLLRALETSSENLPSWVINTGTRAAYNLLWCSVHVGAHPIIRRARIYALGAVRNAVNALRKKMVSGVKHITDTPILCKKWNIVEDFLIGFLPVLTDAIIPKTGCTPITEDAGYLFMARGTIKKNFYGTSLLSRAGIPLNWKSIVSMSIKATSQVICGLSLVQKMLVIVEKLEKCKNKSKNLSIVYDIVNAGPRNRFTIMSQMGPIIVHNCGFGGGVGSFVTFSSNLGAPLEELAKNPFFDKEITSEAENFWEYAVRQKRTLGLEKPIFITCDSFKRLWRRSHPNTVSMWKELEEATRNAIESPGKDFKARAITARRDGNWFRLVQPSGRSLCYPAPRVDSEGKISFMGIDQYTRKFQRIQTYGPKIFENCVQGGARDVFMRGVVDACEADYNCVMRIHDEQIAEVPDNDDFTVAGLCSIMAAENEWNQGLPLAAGGFSGYRYRKE